jgi:uncharacterized protein (TIGR02001 family)
MDMTIQRLWVLLVPFTLSMSVYAGGLNGSVTFVSDYAYRGYSKSRGNPVVQGNLEYAHQSGLYGGLGISPVSFDDKAQGNHALVELNPYIGWTLDLSEHWRTDFSVGRYIYAGKINGQNADYNEFYSALHYRDLLTARLAFAYDAYNQNATTLTYELLGRYSLLDTLILSTGLGFNQASQLFDFNYFYWNTGLTWHLNSYVAVDLRYIDSNLNHAEAASADGYLSPHRLRDRYLLSLSMGF